MHAGPGCALVLLESVGSQQPASFLSSGVSLEDQASYVCEARNVFGKAQAEAQLVVTGHGLWVNLEAVGSGRQVLQPGCGCPRVLLVSITLDQCIPTFLSLLLGPSSPREHLIP